MGKRTSSHVSGDLAEVEVFGHLLRTGAAINNLTGSDTGWDLHLHVPDQIVDVDSSKSWTMSGHSANVQVRFRSKANSARVSIGTMKEWISGSRSGTPTFVFLLDDAGGLNYLTPCDLQNVVNARPNVRATTKTDLRSAPCHAYHLEHFKRVMHFWRTYPQVALAGLPDCPLSDGVRPPADEAVRLVGDVFLGWLRRYAPAELDTDDSIWSRHTDSFTRPYLGHGRFTFAEEVHFTNEVHQYIVWAERSGDGLDPAKYTPSQHPDDVRHHAAGLLDFYFEKG